MNTIFWLTLAVWTTNPREYKEMAQVGPFETQMQCYSMGALLASEMQSKNDTDNVLGACLPPGQAPKFLDYDSMWGMYKKVTGKSWDDK